MHPECLDYDLCEKCESSPFALHPENHPMLKTKIPLRVDFSSSLDSVDDVAVLGTIGATQSATHQEIIIKGSAFEPGQKEDISADTSAPCMKPTEQPSQLDELEIPGSYMTKDLYDQDEAAADLAAPIFPDNKVKAVLEDAKVATKLIPDLDLTPGEIEEHAIKRGEIEEFAAHPYTTATAKKSERVTSDEKVTPLDIFTWVRHSTITPGSTLPAGAEFTKTWFIKHFASGDEYRFNKVKLVHKSEGLLGSACKAVIEYNRAEIKDGREIEVTIHGLKVPDMPGTEVIECWRFEDEDGVEYGQPLRLR